MVKNLAITGRRKLPRRDAYVEVEPELVELSKVLQELSITREQLIDVGILIGTDFNDGVRGIGPKTALKLIRENGRLERILEKDPSIEIESNYSAVRELFVHPNVTSDYSLKWSKPDADKIISFLCGERDFSEDRVRKAVSRMSEASGAKAGGTLESYFS